jgi:hypothetical protein
MTTLENLDDAIQLMRDAGHQTIPLPLDLADYLLACAFFMRAHQGQPVPKITGRRLGKVVTFRARSPERTNDVRNHRTD